MLGRLLSLRLTAPNATIERSSILRSLKKETIAPYASPTKISVCKSGIAHTRYLSGFPDAIMAQWQGLSRTFLAYDRDPQLQSNNLDTCVGSRSDDWYVYIVKEIFGTEYKILEALSFWISLRYIGSVGKSCIQEKAALYPSIRGSTQVSASFLTFCA